MHGIWLFCIACCTLYNLKVMAVKSKCEFITESKREVELLTKLDPLMGKRLSAIGKFKNDSTEYRFNFGFCVNAIDKDQFKNVGMIQTDTEGNSEKTHNLGLYNRTQIKGGEDWIFLIYKDGDTYQHHCLIGNSTTEHRRRESHIMIVCDPETELSELTLIEENKDVKEECYYLFEIGTKYICSPKPKTEENLGAGSIFCIIFFTTAGVYLIIGFLYQRIVVGAKGLEQIPNFSFWKEFGKLQADGCDFLCRCGEHQEMKMYRGIDDQLLNTERRDEPDDRLLPM